MRRTYKSLLSDEVELQSRRTTSGCVVMAYKSIVDIEPGVMLFYRRAVSSATKRGAFDVLTVAPAARLLTRNTQLIATSFHL